MKVPVALLFLAAVLPAVSPAAPKREYSCSLSVSQRPGDSETTGGRRSSILRSSVPVSGTGSKTYKRNMKWRVQVRVRGDRPEDAFLKVYYLAYDSGNKLKLLKDEKRDLELDSNNRAETELVSPTTRYTKTRTRSFSRSRGFSSVRSSARGERIAGAVVQLFVDGELKKSWTSDSRWEHEAEKKDFSVSRLRKNAGRLGGR